MNNFGDNIGFLQNNLIVDFGNIQGYNMPSTSSVTNEPSTTSKGLKRGRLRVLYEEASRKNKLRRVKH